MKTLYIDQNGYNATVNGKPIIVERDLIANAFDFNPAQYFQNDERNNLKFLSTEKMHAFFEKYSDYLKEAAEIGDINPNNLYLIELDGEKYTVDLDQILLFDLVYLFDLEGNQIVYFDPTIDWGDQFEINNDYKVVGDLERFIDSLNYTWLDVPSLLVRNGIRFKIVNS